jgi:hypothetical protein
MQEYIKGRGAQFNTPNRFAKQERVMEHFEGIDELPEPDPGTEVSFDYPKQIVNKVESTDLPFLYSLNPYQGCEHGCAYCYARNAHTYWGLSAGLDFERKIIVKPEAAKLLEDFINKKNYVPATMSLSGNTDCYQPLERTYKITRSLLEVFLKHRHPVGIITKNALILRDLDLLEEMASMQACSCVYFDYNLGRRASQGAGATYFFFTEPLKDNSNTYFTWRAYGSYDRSGYSGSEQ